jgi:hypothetical protein
MAFGEEEVDKIVEKLVDDIPLMVLQQTSMMVGGIWWERQFFLRGLVGEERRDEWKVLV